MLKISLKQNLIKLGIAFFFTYSSVAIALPVVSIFVKESLNLSNWLGGFAVGVSFISTIFSRKYAGNFADNKSSKKCFILGFIIYMFAALICMGASISNLGVIVSFMILIVGRLLLGIGESMSTVGITGWHLLQLGPEHSGKILAVMGMAMYGAFVLGGPMGLALYKAFGFNAVMAVSFIMPIIGIMLFRTAPEIKPQKFTNRTKKSFWGLLSLIGVSPTLCGFRTLRTFE